MFFFVHIFSISKFVCSPEFTKTKTLLIFADQSLHLMTTFISLLLDQAQLLSNWISFVSSIYYEIALGWMPVVVSQHCFISLVPSGNTPLTQLILTKIYVTIEHHQVTIGSNPCCLLTDGLCSQTTSNKETVYMSWHLKVFGLFFFHFDALFFFFKDLIFNVTVNSLSKMMHMCVSELIITGLDNGLTPVCCQAII